MSGVSKVPESFLRAFGLTIDVNGSFVLKFQQNKEGDVGYSRIISERFLESESSDGLFRPRFSVERGPEACVRIHAKQHHFSMCNYCNCMQSS